MLSVCVCAWWRCVYFIVAAPSRHTWDEIMTGLFFTCRTSTLLPVAANEPHTHPCWLFILSCSQSSSPPQPVYKYISCFCWFTFLYEIKAYKTVHLYHCVEIKLSAPCLWPTVRHPLCLSSCSEPAVLARPVPILYFSSDSRAIFQPSISADTIRILYRHAADDAHFQCLKCRVLEKLC